MDNIEFLSKVPLFEGLPHNQLYSLSNIAINKKAMKGQTIFHEREEGRGFYVIIQGKVKIFKFSPEGKEQILQIFREGEPFGEAAIFTGQTFPANAEAIEDSAFLFFPRQAFIGLIKKDPSLVLNMLALLSERLRKFARIIEDLSLKEVPSRLAAYILYHSQMKGLDYLTLDISKNQLASLLGTIPETFSRILTKMKNEGIIEPDGRNNIRVLDKSRLEHLANGESRLT